MEVKSPSETICACLDSLSEEVSGIMPFILLFLTASIAGVAYLISKFLLEGVPALNLLGKIVLTVEVLLLLVAAGNAIGSYAQARAIFSKLQDKKRNILLVSECPEPTKFIAELDKELQPMVARQFSFYQGSYLFLSAAVLLGALAVLVRIWT